MHYTFTTTFTKEKRWYVARCVELGVVSQGKTIDEAKKNIRQAVELFLEDQPSNTIYLSKQAPLITTLDVEYG
jgi:predicted RNase H-like HicB family nuclease